MAVISIRLSESEEAFLKEAGIKPSAFAKKVVQKEVKRMRLEQARRRLESVSRRPSKGVVELLREDRDAH